ncbi:hypothetical protein TWF481_008551 [Arthrobotrys musiformis]|uniref:Uncharacterized protein n=1 Tax=Arthrobotrys musiformis TaxID=47236 RepID=A0AAV9W9C6_9PEZI
MSNRFPQAIVRRLIRPQTTSPFTTYPLSRSHYLYHEPPRRHLSVNSFIPRVFSPTWWSQHLPQGLFKSTVKSSKETVKRKWDPAWGYIVLALFVGSQSLNIMALRQESQVFIRRSDARIETLREIIENIQKGKWAADGEEVQRALRLGKPERDDRQWEEVMKEIEEEDSRWQQEAQRQRERIEQQEVAKAKFTALESPTAYADSTTPEGGASKAAPSRPKKKITADDYFM